MKLVIVLLGMVAAFPAMAQDAPQRQRAALPFVIEQRNNALDGVALCQGDLGSTKDQLAAVQKQLADAQSEIERLKTKPSTDGSPQ